MTTLDTITEQITTWGRARLDAKRGHAVDTGGFFSAAFTEHVRRELLDLARNDTTGRVTGSYRHGYSYHLDSGEVVGVGDGYGRGFVVFYRPAR